MSKVLFLLQLLHFDYPLSLIKLKPHHQRLHLSFIGGRGGKDLMESPEAVMMVVGFGVLRRQREIMGQHRIPPKDLDTISLA